MENMILEYCRNNLTRFSTMTDVEIYNWMCDNFTRKIMRWLENVVGLFLMNPDRFRFLWCNLKGGSNGSKHIFEK